MGLRRATKEKLENLHLPDKPKRPTTPYLKFINEHRAIVKEENPEFKPTEVVKKCAQLWNSSSSSVREKYMQTFKEELKQYTAKVKTYSASLTEEQQQLLKEIEKEKKHDKQRRLQRQLFRESNKPKKPQTPYNLFLSEKSKMTNKSIKVLMSELKGEWAQLPDREKDKYQFQYLKEKERYEREIAAWEEKMLREGRSDMVRVKTLEAKTLSGQRKEGREDNTHKSSGSSKMKAPE
ncbi:transcription factor A, mitochondrial-like isoform X2 [Cylas formicarius]|nr:transcription factor A, mitochondrial-like isoform X2 [Cylas formicarius]